MYKYCNNISTLHTDGNDRQAAWDFIKNVTDEKLKGYLFWTVIRNPYDRFSSMAAMFSSDPNKFAKHFDRYIERGMVYRHTRPQHIYTHFHGICVPTVILRQGNLQNEFDTFCDTLKIPRLELPQMNKTTHKHWSETFNRETLDFVNRYYEKDFEYFNYQTI